MPAEPTAEPDGPAVTGVGLGVAALALLAGLITSTLVATGLIAALGLDDPTELALWAFVPIQIGLWVPMLAIPALAARNAGRPLLPPGWARVTRREVGLAVLVGVGLQLFVIPLVYLPILQLLDDADLSEPARELTDRADGSVGVAALVLITAIGAPVVEEIFHRGVVQPRLIARLAPPGGVAVAAAVFAATHLQLLQLPALTIFGLAVGWWAHVSGRVGPAIVAHVAFNTTALVALALTT